MSVRLSTALRNALADIFGTSWDGGAAVLELRVGAKPANADDAPTGVLVAAITLPADSFAAAAAGVVSKLGTWEDTSADAAGLIGWGRFRESGDAGGAGNTTNRRLDIDVTEGGGGGDIDFDNADINAGQQVTISSYSITQPAA